MIDGKIWNLIGRDEMLRLDEAAVKLLEDTGARIEHGKILDMLGAAGCKVDRSSMRCRFSEELIRKVVSHVGKTPALKFTGPIKWSRSPSTSQGGSFPHLLEWPACKRRLATCCDVEDMARMAHVLPEFTAAGSILTSSEIDPRVEPVWNVVTRMMHHRQDISSVRACNIERQRAGSCAAQIFRWRPGSLGFGHFGWA